MSHLQINTYDALGFMYVSVTEHYVTDTARGWTVLLQDTLPITAFVNETTEAQLRTLSRVLLGLADRVAADSEGLERF